MRARILSVIYTGLAFTLVLGLVGCGPNEPKAGDASPAGSPTPTIDIAQGTAVPTPNLVIGAATHAPTPIITGVAPPYEEIRQTVYHITRRDVTHKPPE